jgi:hypothetical protein
LEAEIGIAGIGADVSMYRLRSTVGIRGLRDARPAHPAAAGRVGRWRRRRRWSGDPRRAAPPAPRKYLSSRNGFFSANCDAVTLRPPTSATPATARRVLVISTLPLTAPSLLWDVRRRCSCDSKARARRNCVSSQLVHCKPQPFTKTSEKAHMHRILQT